MGPSHPVVGTDLARGRAPRCGWDCAQASFSPSNCRGTRWAAWRASTLSNGRTYNDVLLRSDELGIACPVQEAGWQAGRRDRREVANQKSSQAPGANEVLTGSGATLADR